MYSIDMKIELEWNRYKNDGKTWLAKINDQGKYEFLNNSDFEVTKKTGTGVYAGVRTYDIKEDGRYVAVEPCSKSEAYRHEFEVIEGKITNIRTNYKSRPVRNNLEGKLTIVGAEEEKEDTSKHKYNMIHEVNGKKIKVSVTWDEFLEMRKKGENIYMPHTGWYDEAGQCHDERDVLADVEDGTLLESGKWGF